MIGMWKRWRPWKRWLVGSLCSVSLLLLSVVGYFYYQIARIDVDEILERHQEQNISQGDSEENDQMPSVVQGQVEKAEQFASKPIETQDAMDVAAILLKSGLSMKEIYYLTGKVSTNISTEEKQKIRDTLLSKLTQEEIAALRSVTSQYGKHLAIVDPNYPIELVGVYDENERKRITEELEKREIQAETTSAFSSSETPASIQSPAPSVEPAVVSEVDTAKMNELADKYQGQLLSVQNSCAAKTQTIVNQIKADMKNNSISIEQLQSNYLGKIAAAEERCDNEFNHIVSAAEKDFKLNQVDPTTIVEKWKKEYEAAKSQEKNKAISNLLK